MKRYVLIGLLLCFGALSLSAQVKLRKYEIAYDTTYSLTWDDFRSKSLSPKSPEAAEVALRFYFSAYYDESKQAYVLEVVAAVDTKQSWVRKDAKNDTVLNHEQLHFDIQELYARKLRKVMREEIRPGKQLSRKALRLFKKIHKELDKCQTAYDKETRHGIDAEAQQEWDQKIREELESLKEYSDPILVGV